MIRGFVNTAVSALVLSMSNVHYRVPWDITAPVVTLNTTDTVESQPSLSGTIDDSSASIQVVINSLVYPATNNGDGSWTLAAGVIPPLVIGYTTVEVQATDQAGNIGNVVGNVYRFYPTQLFTSSEQGLIYDFNDFSTLFQDNTGTIPVTAAGQPVGLVLDKHLGQPAVRRNRLIFSEAPENAAWLLNTASVSGSGLGAKLVEAAGTVNPFIYQTVTIPDGSTVTISRTVKAGERSFCRLQVSSSSGAVYAATRFDLAAGEKVAGDSDQSANGGSNVSSSITSAGDGYWTIRVTVTLPTGVTAVRQETRIVPNSTSFSYTGDGVSGIFLREAQTEVGSVPTSYQKITSGTFGEWTPGNHAAQSSSASRPMLRQSPIPGNELVVNGNFDNGTTGWSAVNATISIVGSSLRVTGNASSYPSGRQQVSVQTGKTYIIEWTHRSVDGSASSCLFIRPNGYDDPAGQLSPQGTTSTSFVSRRAVFTATTNALYLRATVDSGVTSASAEFDNISIREIVGYSTSRNYLEFDGLDDFLLTNSIDFTATDKVTIFAGVRKMSDAAVATLVELSSSTALNNGTFAIFAPLIASSARYTYRSRGTTTVDNASSTSYAAPISSVLSCVSSISGDINTLRVSGTTFPSAGDQGTGNYGNYPLFLGRRAGASLPFSGYLYGLTITGKMCNATEITYEDRRLGLGVGVTI